MKKTSKLHVVILPSSHYCPSLQTIEGIFQRHLVELLSSRGLKVGVVSFGLISWRQLFSQYPYVKEECQGDVCILRRFVRPLLPPRFAMCVLKTRLISGYVDLMNEYIQKYGRPDVIHAHNSFYAGLAAARIRQEFEIPFVLTEHSSDVQSGIIASSSLAEIQEVIRVADRLSAVGGALAACLTSYSSEEIHKPCSVLGNLLDPFLEYASLLEPPSRSEHPDKGAFDLLAIGSLVPIKNHSLLLRAFARAFREDSSVCLRIGGSGPLERALREEARRLGIESKVAFLGYLDRNSVVKELRNCNALVSTSLTETFGVVLIEAMAFGKPVVATRCGGPEDFIGDEQGLLADMNEESVAQALIKVRNSKYNSQRIREYCISRFGSDAFFQRLWSLYCFL